MFYLGTLSTTPSTSTTMKKKTSTSEKKESDFVLYGIVGGAAVLVAFIMVVMVTCIKRRRRRQRCNNNLKIKIKNQQKQQDIINEIIKVNRTGMMVPSGGGNADNEAGENHVYTGLDEPTRDENDTYERLKTPSSTATEEHYEKYENLNLKYTNLENTHQYYQPYEIMPHTIMETLNQTGMNFRRQTSSIYEVLPDD